MEGPTIKNNIKKFVLSTHQKKPHIFENRKLRGEFKHPEDLDKGHQREIQNDISENDL